MTGEDSKSHVVCELEDHRGGRACREPGAIFSASFSRPVEVEQSNEDASSQEIVSLIRGRLEEHLHFRGRASLLQIETIGGVVVLSGRLPTYYLKQLLQEAVKKIPDVAHIDNRVEVTFQ
jgi:hypothetical protein